MSNRLSNCSRACLAGALLLCVAAAGCNRQPPAPAARQAATPAASAATDAKSGVFEITGTIPDVKDGTAVHLILGDEGALPDPGVNPKPAASAKVSNGRFMLTGSVTHPGEAWLLYGDDAHPVANFVIENAKFRLEPTDAGVVVRGGDVNEQVNGYLWSPPYLAASKEAMRISDAAYKGVDPQDEKAMKVAQAKADPSFLKTIHVRDDYQHAILSGNASPVVKMLTLRGNTDWKRYPSERRNQIAAAWMRELGPEHPLTTRYQAAQRDMEQSIKTQSALAVGATYKPIEAVDADGKTVKLADVLKKNKLVMVDFWASWCGPCRGEFPFLNKVYKEFHDKGFEIYAVSMDNEKADWLKALKEEKAKGSISWINLVDPKGYGGEVAKLYGVSGLPDSYLIDSDGKIVGRGMHAWDIEREVRARLKSLDGGKSN